MSGTSFTRTSPVFGPVKRSKLDLMGIRFAENGGGNNGGYVPPATQADLDRIVNDRLARQKAQYAQFDGVDLAALQANAAELVTLKATQGNDVQELTSKLAAAETRAVAAESSVATSTAEIGKLQPTLLRYEVAAEAKIPLSHAPRLLGSTREELVADAATYKTSLRTGGYDPGQGQDGTGGAPSDAGTAEADRRFGTQNK